MIHKHPDELDYNSLTLYKLSTYYYPNEIGKTLLTVYLPCVRIGNLSFNLTLSIGLSNWQHYSQVVMDVGHIGTICQRHPVGLLCLSESSLGTQNRAEISVGWNRAKLWANKVSTKWKAAFMEMKENIFRWEVSCQTKSTSGPFLPFRI